MKIVADLLKVGVPPAGPRGAAAAPEADAPIGGAAVGRASLYHMLLHILLLVAAVLFLLFARCLVLSLGCVRTYGPVSRRRGRLGGRILGL